ncbi:DNA replication regulator SLD3-domain-containing protein [Emericellopsis atlantica]|uniref:DNA replication regulator SLD3-domain-containing protein n=1 Tax=Emericellopsis atlantica TaxID=2614577 RepID=A0A9P7ZDU0_9HYPO|nr:DNA replication regulator SLD3-domain-containing protein [Emericellopsis atlantica]KAG9249891.1 DNA replication regulator SLD3-domain-containing protein [Emericellopsis atlantica]
MSDTVLPGADASRPRSRSGILTPTSDGSTARDGKPMASPDSRKRKRSDSMTMDHLLKSAISLKVHPPNLQIQPRTLLPLMLLPRKHLSLASLDLSCPQEGLHASRFYASHVKILDLESRMGSSPSVLIVRNESRGRLYALERTTEGLYTACKLGSWVDIQALLAHATVVCRERCQPPTQQAQCSDGPGDMAIPAKSKADIKVDLGKRAAIESLTRKNARSHSISTIDTKERSDTAGLPGSDEVQSSEGESPRPQISSVPAAPLLPKPSLVEQQPKQQPQKQQKENQQTAESLCDNIRTHYLEALYLSKGSLAYFAKGPLSRARAAFHLNLESTLDINDLIEFLKSLILTTVQVDKKFRETIPAMLAKTKTFVDSSDEGRKKRRKSKKMKVGKDGLYPMEVEILHRWWTENQPALAEDSEAGVSLAQIKDRVDLLRTRETQLQMIVIMETMALEQAAQTHSASLPELTESQHTATPPSTKKRSKHNLPMLVDVHADRLTIWQSMASDAHILLQDTQATEEALATTQQKASSEPLRDFCVDVIVPFYASRLPQLCHSLSQKFGGPVIIPPTKRAKPSRSSSKQDLRPGASLKRPAPAKEPRSLKRALSMDQQHRRSLSGGQNALAELMRTTTTTTALPSIKREASDSNVLKSMVNEARTTSQGLRPLSRSSSSMTLDDPRANKKAKIDAELREAITALRKPNREVVGKALAEADGRKNSTAHSHKKPRKGPKYAPATGVQVKATPMNQRFKEMTGAGDNSPFDIPLPSTEDVVPPSSAGPVVPSTSQRDGYGIVPPTPSRGVSGRDPVRKLNLSSSFLRRPATELPSIPPSSPVMTRRADAIPESPMAPPSISKPPTQPSSFMSRLRGVPETPIKKQPAKPLAFDDLEKKQPTQTKPVSIYQKLGWDDDDDLDDLF